VRGQGGVPQRQPGRAARRRPGRAVEAARRIRQVLDDAERPADEPLLIEEYLPGPELSVDGVLTAGDLTVTAVFDKPDMPDGPTFEETLLVSPSRLAAGTLAAAVRTAADAARALGLSDRPGPRRAARRE
jgi:hypothetical protein